jgi:hypothetical protein
MTVGELMQQLRAAPQNKPVEFMYVEEFADGTAKAAFTVKEVTSAGVIALKLDKTFTGVPPGSKPPKGKPLVGAGTKAPSY